MPDLRMPSLGSDMEAGTLVAWRRRPGDRIARGDIVAEVETDKGVLEVEAYEAGVIESLLVEPGARVPVGTALARLRDGETQRAPLEPGLRPAPRAAPPPVPAAPAAPSPRAPGTLDREALLRRFPPSIRRRARAHDEDPMAILAARVGLARPSLAPPGARARASPWARRRAHELDVDLATVRATGDAITGADVERAARARAARPSAWAEPAAGADDARTRMRRAIAASMERSNREIPHYWVATTIDLGAASAWLERANQTRGVERRLVVGVLLIKAVALALRRVPELNATWTDGTTRTLDHIDLGIAVSLRGGGLVAPAIPDVDTLDLDATMLALADVVARARTGRLRASELTRATCTVTSLGERGVETVTPRIAPPQVAMIGLGRVVVRPWVVEGAVVARSVVTATLAGDHRVSDGHRGAAFLTALDALLQTPEAL